MISNYTIHTYCGRDFHSLNLLHANDAMREMSIYMHHHDDQAVHTRPYGVMVRADNNSGNMRVRGRVRGRKEG